NCSTPSTAIPTIRNGRSTRQTIGKTTSASSARGQQMTNRRSHSRNFVMCISDDDSHRGVRGHRRGGPCGRPLALVAAPLLWPPNPIHVGAALVAALCPCGRPPALWPPVSPTVGAALVAAP